MWTVKRSLQFSLIMFVGLVGMMLLLSFFGPSAVGVISLPLSLTVGMSCGHLFAQAFGRFSQTPLQIRFFTIGATTVCWMAVVLLAIIITGSAN